ncbi:DUF4136 domain-containing protein [Curvibacter sp. CHRR-16]|uniref:DUF4136 domain-containing protein n=1 Tax=Curvibacter sp. CHRR-16 TaxID=2835872 RepID=UPI001BDAC7C9|nr:DUF4136 domain-containing protein [Curvibacter sp. CHRR-16]MBT0570939.1 DUF4136 domain-containing protein [Curvibacter sp. CHRR-16]
MALGLGLLTGCATSRMIDSDVSSFSSMGDSLVARTDASFAIEHLPSQNQGLDASTQAQLDTITTQALEAVGLHSAGDKAADYLAQLQVRVDTIANPHYRPRYRDWVRDSNGQLVYTFPTLQLEPSWYRHQVQLLLRDTHSNRVVYEARATFDGPWRDTLNLLPPMLQAALRDYPHTLQGKVVVELPAPAH